MSVKKILVGVVIFMLVLGGVYVGTRMQENRSERDRISVYDPAPDEPLVEVDSEDTVQNDRVAEEESPFEEEIIMSTSAGVKKRADAARLVESFSEDESVENGNP